MKYQEPIITARYNKLNSTLNIDSLFTENWYEPEDVLGYLKIKVDYIGSEAQESIVVLTKPWMRVSAEMSGGQKVEYQPNPKLIELHSFSGGMFTGIGLSILIIILWKLRRSK
jgi:hypothetical protein